MTSLATGSGGTGTWDTTSVFWQTDGASPNVAWTNTTPTGNDARFFGTAGTITLGAPIVVRQLDFNTPGYTLTNGGNAANTLTLAGTDTGFYIQSGAMSVDALVLGTDGLVVDDATTDPTGSGGTLTLSNTSNTYRGVTRIRAGVLETTNLTNVGIPSSIGVGGDQFQFGFVNLTSYLSLDGGALRYIGTGTSTNRVFTITNRGGTIDSSGAAGSLGFSLAGGGVDVTGIGARTFTLTGTNIGNNNIASPIGDSLDPGAGNKTLSLVKSGTGTWVMTAPHLYSGSTTISGGTLVTSSLADGGAPSHIGASSSLPQNLVLDGGTLRYIGGTATTNRPFTLGPAGARIESAGTGPLSFTNPVGVAATGSGARTLTLTGTANGLLRVELADPTTVWALNGSNQLLRFNPASPDTIEQTLSINGLSGGESLHSIDYRPLTGVLFAMGTTNTGGTNRIYSIDTSTGVATEISTVTGLTLTGGNPGGSNGYYSFDFNPANDTIRVVGADGQNVRINPAAFNTFTTDTGLSTTDTVNLPNALRVTGIAYSSASTLYGIDALNDALVRIDPENGGIVSFVGRLSRGPFLVNINNTTSDVGFDIASNGIAYASMRVGGDAGSDYRFYSIDLANGAAQLLGATANPRIGNNATVRDIAVAINGTTSLLKTGRGTWTLDRLGANGGHSYSGTTTIAQGTLVLNFDQAFAGAFDPETPYTQIINPRSSLIMSGGTLAITGTNGRTGTAARTFTNVQNFNGVTVLPGASQINPVAGTNGSTMSVDLGTLSFGGGSRQLGTTLALSAVSAINTISMDAAHGVAGHLGAWATVGGRDWVSINAGSVEAFSGYTDVALGGSIPNAGTSGAASNVRINSGTDAATQITLAGPVTTITALSQDHTTAATVNTAGQTLRLAGVGGILVGTGRSALTIGTSANSGTLTAGGTDHAAGELILLNNSTNLLTINSVVANNGSGAVTLMNAGTGVAALNAANTYTGGTILSGGTLRIGDNRALSTGTITVLTGPTLPTLASTNNIGREIINNLDLKGDLNLVDATGTGGLVLRGVVDLNNAERTISVSLANGYVSLAGSIINGSLVKSGPGALALLDVSLSIGSITIAQGSLDLWSPTGLGTTPIFAEGTAAAPAALSASGAFYSPVSATIFAGGNMTLGRPQVSDGIDLGGLIDLGNTTDLNPRLIATSGAQPQQQQRISGKIVSGTLGKTGSSELYITGNTSTYEGRTIVFGTTTGSSLRVSPTGRLGANVFGNDILVLPDPLITPLTANTFAILRLDSIDTVQSQQAVYLNNFTTVVGAGVTNYATPMLGWGAAFEANPEAIGFIDYFTALIAPDPFSLTGLKYIRVYDQNDFSHGAPGPVGITIDGIRSGVDVIGKVHAAVPNADVWLGATLLGGTYVGQSLSTGSDSTYRLGGGGGFLTIANANVLTGANNVVTGSPDQTGRGLTGTVYLAQPQNFSGTLTVGVGTTLVVGTNSALGTGSTPIRLATGTLNLRTAGTHGSDDFQYAGRNFEFVAGSTIQLDPIGGGQNGRIHVGALDFAGVVAAPTFTVNSTNNLELRVNGPVTLRSNLIATPNSSLTTTFTINSGFVTIDGTIGQTATTSPGANLVKAGAGTLILTQPSTHTGITTANGGTLVLTVPNAISGPMVLQTGTLSLRSDAPSTTTFSFSNFSLNGTAAATLFVGGIAAFSEPIMEVPQMQTGNKTGLIVNGTNNARFRVAGVTTLGANFTMTVNSARTELVGGIGQTGTSAFNFTKAGIGTLTISGANSLDGNTTVTQGTMVANHSSSGIVDTFGSGTLGFGGTLSGGILIAGTRTLEKDIALNSNGGTQVLGGLGAGTKIFSGNIAITDAINPETMEPVNPNNSGVTLTAETGGDVTFTGTISGGVGGNITIGSTSGNVLIPILGTPAVGRGTVILNPSSGTGNTFTRPVLVQNGTLIGHAQATSGSPFGNSNNPLSVNNGVLQLNGRGSNTTTTNGALTVGGGARLIVNNPNGSFTTQFSLASLARAGVGTLTYVPQTGSGEIVNFAAAPALVNGILPPWIVRATSGVNGAGDFVTLSSGNLATASYTAGNLDAATSTQIFNVTTGGPLTGDRAVYALKSAVGIDLGGRTLRIGDTFASGADVATAAGGIILNGGASIGSGTLDLGQAEGVIYVDDAATADISASITGTAGLTGATPSDVRTATVAANQRVVTSGSSILNGLPSTARLSVGSLVTGSNIPANTFVTAVLSPTSVQMSANATGSSALGANVALTFNGASALTKIGAGTLRLSGTNTYRGTTVINEGVLQMGAVNAIGRYTNSGLLVPSNMVISSRGTLDLNGFDTEIGNLTGAFGAVVNVGDSKLTLGRNSNTINITTTFSGQILGGANGVIQKVGAGTIVLDNTRGDVNASSFAGSVFVDQGALTVVVADGTNGSPYATRNSLPPGLTINVRGGTLNLRTSGDNTTAQQNLVGGYNIVISGANGTVSADRFSGTETNKIIELGNLTLGRNEFVANTANSIALSFAGTTTLTDNARINSNELTLKGVVTDGGAGFTLNKVGGNLFLNNPLNDYSGGTVLTGGNLFFGARGPDVLRFPGFGNLVPNDKARAGTGPIIVNTNSVVNLNDTDNLAAGQTVRIINSALANGNNSAFVIQTDRPVSDFNLRASGRGSLQIGVQNSVYSTPIDMSKIGNGEWGLTSGRSVEALYTAAKLSPGAGNVHRFYGSSGAAFVIMEANAVTGGSTVELGRQLTDAGANPGNSNAQIRFMRAQDYTGNTLIHRAATTAGVSNAVLDIRSTIASPNIEVYGRLFATGAGTFTNAAENASLSTQRNNVILRPGSELALDYNNNANNNTNFLVPVGATSATGFLNKWADTQPIILDGASLRVVSAAGSLTTEIIGAVTYKGAAEIFPQSAGTGGNSVVIINGTLTRTNLGTLAFRSNASRLGVSGEPGTNEGQRVVFSSDFSTPANLAASGVYRGVVNGGSAHGTVIPMVSPRFYSNTANTFVDYAGDYVGDPFNPLNFQATTVLGFSDVPFITRANQTVFNESGLNNGTEILDLISNTPSVTNATVVNPGADVWALKTNIDIGSSSTTNAIKIRSGGLAVTDAGEILAPLLFRNGDTAADNVEADVWTVSGTVTLRGRVTAQSLVKTGAGTLVLAADNTFTPGDGTGLQGTIQVNGGVLQLGGVNAAGADVTAAQALGSVTDLRLHAGNFNNGGNQMPQVNLRSNTAATYSQKITISEFVPFAVLNVDRISGTGTNQSLNVDGGITIEGGGSDGTVLLFTNGNDFDFTSSGPTVLGLPGNTARIGINVTNTSGTNNVVFTGQVSGPAPLVKSGNGPLTLSNATNSFTGGIVINDGTLDLRNASGGTLAGTGPIELNRGTLRVSTETAAVVNVAPNSSNHLTIRGQSILQFDRISATTTSVPTLGGTDSIFTTQNSPTVQINSGGSIARGEWAGKTLINDSPLFNVAQTIFRLGNALGGDSLSGAGHIYKTGANVLELNNDAAGSMSGGMDIFQGQVRALTSVATAFGTGSIRISPSGVLGVTNTANVTGSGQIVSFHSNSTALAGLAIRATGTAPADFPKYDPASYLSGTNISTAAGNGGLLAIDSTYASTIPALDLGALYDGNWFLGSTSGAAYQAALTAGAGSTYRLGGGGSTLTLSTTQAMLTGTGNKVMFGKPHGLAGNGTVVIDLTSSDYTGGTTISRVRDTGGGFTVSAANIRQGFTSTPLGSGAVDVFGNVVIEAASGSATSDGGGNRNAFTFHPGARLLISNTTNYTGGAPEGRWGDGVGIDLRSSGLEMIGSSTAGNEFNSETVGAVTFNGGSEVRIARSSATSDAQLVLNGALTRQGAGTLTINTSDQNNAGVTGALGSNTFGSGAGALNILVNSSVPMTNNMVAPYVISRTENQFVRYDDTLGFEIIHAGNTPNYESTNAPTTLTASVNDGTRILNYDTITSGAATTLGANLNVHALRLRNNVHSSADGQFNTVTIGSGGLLMLNNNDNTTISLNANAVFGSTATPGEALIAFNAVGTNRFAALNGRITASSVTKFGTGLFSIAQDQTGFTGAWDINQGQLQILTPGGLGSGPVNLNGWTGNTGQTQTELRFNFNPGTPDELVFSSGKITSTDLNIIRAQTAADRTVRIAAIDAKTTNAVPQTGIPGVLRIQVDGARSLLRTGPITFFDDYVLHVDATSFGPGSTTGVRPDALNNAGTYDLTKLGDGVLILGDNSSTFTGGRTLTVNEGAVRVLGNGSLGGIGTTAIIDNGGAIEIATPGFSPVGTLTQRSGSIERWAVSGARSGTVNLPAGVHLQVAANQSGTQEINLNGGSIMGYLPMDVDSIAVVHNLGPNVSVNLQTSSMIGQPYPAGTNVTGGSANHVYYDMGKGNQFNNLLDSRLNGSLLDIRGSISGATGNETLTKVGLDVVQLSGNNQAGLGFNTVVREGVLQLGSATALPATKSLTMRSNGTLDLNGFDATVGSLTGDSPQTTIVNSAAAPNTLTVNMAGTGEYIGGFSGNLNFVKTGANLTLRGTLAHSGTTTVMQNTLSFTGTATGTSTFKVNGGATLNFLGQPSQTLRLAAGQTLAGGNGTATAGNVFGAVTAQAESTIAPGFEPGLPGKLQISSNLTLESNSQFKLEIADPGAIAGLDYDQLIVSSPGTVAINGAKLDLSVAFGSVAVNEVYWLIVNNSASAGATSGTFLGLPQLSFFSANGYEFQINYAANFGTTDFNTTSGNDVAILVTVPEPGSFAGLCAGLGTLLGLRRFRRRT